MKISKTRYRQRIAAAKATKKSPSSRSRLRSAKRRSYLSEVYDMSWRYDIPSRRREEVPQDVSHEASDDVSQDVSKDGEQVAALREKRAAPAPEPEWRPLFDEALVLYQQGVNGDAAAVPKTLELLERLRAMVPDNNLVKAYYGATLVLTGREPSQSPDRFRNVLRGLKTLDEAVAAEPDNVEVRLLRGFVNRRLPELYFHRHAMAAEDFAFVASKYEQDNSLLPQDLYWRALYEGGAAHKKLENYAQAQQMWKKLQENTTDDRYQELLRREKKILDRQHKDGTEAKTEWKKRWVKELPEEGLQLYERALEGDREATFQAFEIFSQALEKHRKNPLVQAYYADCLSMTGKYQHDVPGMIGITIKAMKTFDRLVAAYPDNVQLRFMRAYHSFRLPETFFHRTATAIEDFHVLTDRYREDSSIMPEPLYWQMLYDLGASYARLGMEEEARQVWAQLTEQNADPRYRELVENQTAEEMPDFSQWSKEELFAEGKRLHDLGVAGNRRAALQARECWRIAHETNPGDILAQAYYGSALALSARDAVEPEQIFRTTYHGLNLLNEAVELEPDNLEIRLLRAFVLNALPSPFFPSRLAKEDFQVLKEAYERDHSVFSRQLYERIVQALERAQEQEGTPLSGMEARVSPMVRQWLAGKAIQNEVMRVERDETS